MRLYYRKFDGIKQWRKLGNTRQRFVNCAPSRPAGGRRQDHRWTRLDADSWMQPASIAQGPPTWSSRLMPGLPGPLSCRPWWVRARLPRKSCL